MKKQRYKIVHHEWKVIGEEPKSGYSIWRKKFIGWELYGRIHGWVNDGMPQDMFETVEEAIKEINEWHYRLYDVKYNETYETSKVVKEIELNKDI